MTDTKTPAPDVTSTLLTQVSSRRSFLRSAGAVAAGVTAAGAMAACSTGNAAPKPAANRQSSDSDHAGGAMAAHPTTAGVAAGTGAAADMDAMHEKGMKAFPAKTEGKGNQPFPPKVVGGVKVFEITASKIQWETEPGKRVEAWAYNEQVPGPQIRVQEGDRVRIVLTNRLEQSTAMHFHGLELPNDVDGVPYVTQQPIKAGETKAFEFTVPVGNAGSHMYHSHHNAAEQVGKGLLGAFIVEPRRPRAIEKVDRDYVMILNDGFHGYTLNGKSFPATEPIAMRLGETLRIRFMNEGMMIHPMHLHGIHMTVIDKDGWPQPAPWKCDTLNVAPGERWDVIVKCTNPGVWAFHCHILPHAESPHGMFGMVTALIVEDPRRKTVA